MKILIPMAGRGSRFAEVGYHMPKPLIDVNGRPMIARVLDNLRLAGDYIFIIQKAHQAELVPVLQAEKPGCVVIVIDGVTEGAACTCLLAKDYINNDDHLLVANCDQIMDWDADHFLTTVTTTDVDAYILTFESSSKNNSYAKLNRHGYVTRVAEKQVISNVATCGVYHWREGRIMVESCEKMVAGCRKWNNEYYLCPSYNEMIEDGYVVKTYPVRRHTPIGTPAELEAYLATL